MVYIVDHYFSGRVVQRYTLTSALKFDVGVATDAEEASALGYQDNYIDVYSNSWGPSDFGFIVDGPDTLVQSTLRTGVTEVCARVW